MRKLVVFAQNLIFDKKTLLGFDQKYTFLMKITVLGTNSRMNFHRLNKKFEFFSVENETPFVTL